MRAFLYDNGEGTEVILKSIDESITWWELNELYFNFLQASGYQLTRAEFAESVSEGFL